MFKKKKDLTDPTTSPEFENSVTGVEPILKKKKGKKVAIISGISAAVLVGGGIAAYNLSPLIKNQVKLRTMKPENYYAWVNTENAETFAKGIREKYEKMLDNYGNGTNTSMSLKYVPTDIAKDWAENDWFSLDAENDSADQVLYDFINDLENVQLNIDVQKKNGNSLTSVSGLINDEQLLSADVFVDSINMDYFMRIPELTQRWLGFSVSDAMDDESREIFQIYQDILSDPASYLSPDELDKEIIKYTDLWNTCIEDVKLEKSEEVGICDIEVKYTIASVKIDGELAYKLSENFLTAIRDDEIIRNIAVNKIGLIDENEYEDELNEALDDIKADYDAGDYDYDETVTFSTYIDAQGTIRGFEFKEDSENKFVCAFGKDKDDVRGEISLTSCGEEDFCINLYAEETSKNVYGGSIDINYTTTRYNDVTDELEDTEETVSVEFDNFEIVNKDKFYFNADVTLKIPDTDPIDLSFTADSSSQTISYDINIDEEDYGTVSLTYSASEGSDFEVPDKESSFMIDIYDDEEPDFTQYVSKDEMEAFICVLLEKLGFDKDISAEAAKETADEIYDDTDWDFGGYDPDDNFLYGGYEWDDYDYDYDDEYYDYDWDDFDLDSDEYMKLDNDNQSFI
ncbi:MAG: hypothetical protein NC485_04205 [Ruminococcus flavefaciens]|nr:hypothetical protein [Ruminococcus flavefaciens]MCM1058948.1 hypothetical protein [Eubacterium sp.]